MSRNNPANIGRASTRRKPGPPKGTYHAGSWLPGQSGNPSGRPKKGPEMKELEQLCRESAQTALDFLLDAVTNEDQPGNVRLAAAREILDRGFGKPVDRQVQLSLSNTGSTGERLSKDQLLRIAAGALGEQAREPAQVIDIAREKGGTTPPSDLK